MSTDLFKVIFLRADSPQERGVGKIFPGLENLTKESIENIINFPKNINNSKAKNELGLKISSLDKTVKDAIYR